MKAVDEHADILRQSASDVGNDYRLGADEAPPAIISIFLGEQLEDVVKQLVETGEAANCIEGGVLETGVSYLPDLEKDATDRNRTSPFAFTGNKFEFRMVGSQDSIGDPNVILNTIAAEAFADAADKIEGCDDIQLAVHDIIKENMTRHQRIIFNGDGYSEDWIKEAKRRGLPNLPTMLDAVETLTTDKSIELFEKFNIFTKAELESRKEVLYEKYAKTMNIEATCMVEMASKQIIPSVITYIGRLTDTVIATDKVGVNNRAIKEILYKSSDYLDRMQEALTKLQNDLEFAQAIKDYKDRAFAYRDKVKVTMDELRVEADKLEMVVDKKDWPIPTYGDLLFEV